MLLIVVSGLGGAAPDSGDAHDGDASGIGNVGAACDAAGAAAVGSGADGGGYGAGGSVCGTHGVISLRLANLSAAGFLCRFVLD